jgi:glycosyltransferase involved in cell wall biosynthesis
MKVLILNSYDIEGGAARAAYRIHQSLIKYGLNSTMLVQGKWSDDASIVVPFGGKIWKSNGLRRYLDSLPLTFYKNRTHALFSIGWLPNTITNQISQLNPDILNLQWVTGGFVPLTMLPKLNAPLVWTLHDCWAFTGGCHYPLDCIGFHKNCGCCPQLASGCENDLSRWVWKRKANYWKNLNLTVVVPSRWMADMTQDSSLFHGVRIEMIPYCLDLTKYRPIDKGLACNLLGIPSDKIYILFSSLEIADKRKGFQYLINALDYLDCSALPEEVQLMILGSSQKFHLKEISLASRPLGRLHDDLSLALAYAAADVFVAPSVQDNLPNTVLEASACGTPTVAFTIGGMPDLVEHLNTGYLARPFDSEDLAQGIQWVLSDKDRHQRLRKAARAKAEREFNISRIADKYLSLYEDIIRKR